MIDQQASATTPRAVLSPKEQLQFERLLAELSAGFINLPAERIDNAIEDALRRIVETLGIDRSTLTSVSAATGVVLVSHSYAAAGLEPAPRMLAQESFPWVLATMRAGRSVVFSRVDDLPADARVDKASYRRIGLKSHVSMPMIVAGEFQGVLSFGCLRREKNWPENLLGRLRLLAEIFANALARKHAQEELHHAFGFERLLADLSASMLDIRAVDVDHLIPKALQTIGEFLRVDRVALRQLAPTGGHYSLMHYWCAAGVPAPPAIFQMADAPWTSDRLLRGEVVRFADLSDLPVESSADTRALEAFGSGSLLLVPLRVDGSVAGLMSLATPGAKHSWTDALIPRVKLIGEVLVNVLERDRKSTLLAEAHAEAVQYRERLAHIVRVHTVGEMSAALAHEITQPLGAIENYAIAARRRALERVPDLAKIVDLLDKTIGQATRAGDVVMRLRGLAKRHDLDPKEIDLEHTINTCIAMVKTDCELRDVRLEVKAAGRLPAVVADEIHIQQVVLNLLRNAMDALEPGRPDNHRDITIQLGLHGPDAVRVQVADRGAGIAEGDLERVFESFYTTKPGGLGIGLAICRKLIEAHGGTLWATHNSGGGAVFQFTLPVAAAGG